MALQSEKFGSIVESLKKDNSSSGDDKTGVPSKSMEYFKRSEESLKGIDKSLRLIQESFAKNKSSEKSDDTKSSGSSRAPGDYTVTEELKGAVGMTKSLGQGIASFASNPVKSISNAFGGVKDYAKDILGTPAGWQPDKEATSSNRTANPESDNVQSSEEIISEEMEQTNELIGENISIAKSQIEELKKIRLALVPDPSLDEYTKNHDKKIIQKFDELIEAVKEGGTGGGGGGLGLGDMLPGARALGRGARALGRGAMSVGRAVLPYALPAAAMVATGAAVDYGLGKLGVGKDEEGKDLKIDTAQDDANWKKMTFGQKVESGIGRGIEKVGSTLFLDNMSREAQADRIKNETQYFKDKDYVGSNKAQDDANWDKMSFGKKILSGINRGGEKLSLFDSTKTTAARIRKETEDLKNVPGAATKAAVTATSSTVSYSDEMKAKGINPEDPDGSIKLGLQGPNSAGTIGAATKAAVAAAAATVPAGGQPVAAPMKDTAKEEKLSKIKKEFQDNEAKEAAAKAKIKEFEKANQSSFIKPTGEVESGVTAGKFSDPKKQAEYDKLNKEQLALSYKGVEIEGKYKIADVGKDVKKMSASYAESLNKKNAEANKAGRHPTGQPHKTDYKEGDETGLNEFEARRKYTAALKERGIADKDISVMNPEGTYDAQIEKEIRSKSVTGGPGAKIPAPGAKNPAPVVESTSINEKFEAGKFSEAEFMRKDPANFKKYQAFKVKRQEEIAQNSPFFKLDEAGAMSEAEDEATEEAAKKFQKEINASKAGDVKVAIEKTVEKVSGGPGAKNPAAPSTAAAVATPVVERKSVDTAAPGKVAGPAMGAAAAVIKPVTDVDKVQQAAKEKYQASTAEEKAASEKLKAFEKENPFDYREKPTATQDFLEMPGTGKFKDPKKQKVYDDIIKAKEQASDSKKSAGAAYTAAEGVTKTHAFTGGVQPSKPGDKGGIQGKIDSEISGMQSDGAKIEALKKRGYSDKDLGRDDTLKQNYIQMSDGAKYPNKNLGKYENIVKSELETPVKAGLITPKANNVAAGVAAAVGAEVIKASTDNIDLNREALRSGNNVTPIVSNNISTNNNTSYVPMKPTPRNERGGSALDRYQDRVSAF